MNKVITIHLHGFAFQLEEAGYDALRAYLDHAARQLAANPDKAEILADIEQAIADRFRAFLNANRNVVLAAEVQTVLTEMGPVTDDTATSDTQQTAPRAASASTSGTEQGADTAKPAADSTQPRRLYRLTEGAMIAGVCNGLAAYLGVDVSLVRIIAVVLTFVSFGTVAIAYGIGALVIPEAKTPEEKAAATSPAPTAQEFIRMARDGYYAGMKSFPDREARREWKRKFRREMRDWRWGARHGMACPPPGVPPMPPPVGYPIILPLLATLKTVLHLGCLFLVIMLIATGALFGVALPGGIPVWLGVVLLVLVCNIILAPIKALRRAYYARLCGWPTYPWNPLIDFGQAVLVLFCVLLGLWMMDHFVPGFHDVLQNIPAFCRNVFAALQDWWNHR